MSTILVREFEVFMDFTNTNVVAFRSLGKDAIFRAKLAETAKSYFRIVLVLLVQVICSFQIHQHKMLFHFHKINITGSKNVNSISDSITKKDAGSGPKKEKKNSK
jgi:hypothetical protein